MCQVPCENEENKDRHKDSRKGASQLKMYSYLQALHSSICPSKQASLLPFYLCIFSLVSALRFISMFSSNCVPLNTSSILTTQPPFRISMTLRPTVSSFVVSSEVTNYQSAVTAGTRQLEAMKTFITPKVWLNLQCLRPHLTLTHLNSQASDPKKDNIPVTGPNNHLRGKQH